MGALTNFRKISFLLELSLAKTTEISGHYTSLLVDHLTATDYNSDHSCQITSFELYLLEAYTIRIQAKNLNRQKIPPSDLIFFPKKQKYQYSPSPHWNVMYIQACMQQSIWWVSTPDNAWLIYHLPIKQLKTMYQDQCVQNILKCLSKLFQQ